MTGFGEKHVSTSWGEGIWEIKSVNHRYLDISVKLPIPNHPWQLLIEEKIAQQFQRGRIDCELKFLPNIGDIKTVINTKKVAQCSSAISAIENAMSKEVQIDYLAFIKHFDVLDENDWIKNDDCRALLNDALTEALTHLQQARLLGGKVLLETVQSKLDILEQYCADLDVMVPTINMQLRKTLEEKIQLYSVESNPARLEQEIVFYLQRCDVAEELTLLTAHIKSMHALIKTKGATGKKLDFFLQEANRESNTFIAKIKNVTAIQKMIEVKLIIEQIREQAQNIM